MILLRRILSALLFSVLFLIQAHAQQLSDDYSFYRNTDIPVITAGDTLAMPWAGGMNSVRISEIDLNGDQVNDLFVFEKHGNRCLTFLRVDNRFEYAPEYAHYFPPLHDWVILKDFNNDGKPDIFTYGLAGITVYKNISTDKPQFELLTEQLQAYYYNGYVNIYASPDDYLVIEDIDHDGHLDILNFWVLGKFVHHLRNQSDNPELLDFRLMNECWGHFEEAADNNTITLFSDCDHKSDTHNESVRHTGSSMLLHDFDGNGLPDLLLGDVDAPNLYLLYNNGTLSDARMTQMDTAFPAGAPVHLYSMPAPSMIFQSNNEHPTLIISPSDPSLTKSNDKSSVWRYDYNAQIQQYTLSNTAFLQEDMIDVGSGAHPILYDWDNDGRTDLFIANYGCFDSAKVVNGFLQSDFSSSIQYYQNKGTSQMPVFELSDADFGRLRTRNYQALYPAFGDFDADGLTDMLCGQKDGTLTLITHQQITDGNGLIIDHYGDIDVGAYSTPTFFDLDRDGRKDLIIGNQRGLLSYYQNIGTCGLAVFQKITDTLGGVDVRDFTQSYFGYSVPCFHRDEAQGTTLFCGNEQGKILYYKHIDNNIDGNFTFQSEIWESRNAECDYCATPIREGRQSGVGIGYLDGDNYPDLITGNWAGGLTYYTGRRPVLHGVSVEGEKEKACLIQPNPTCGHVHCLLPEGEITHVCLYDLCGRILLSATTGEIDLTNIPAGLYVIEINHSIRKKIVKN